MDEYISISNNSIITVIGGINMAGTTLEIKNLHVEIEGNKILKGVNLTIKGGEFLAEMGPDFTDKSTLASAIMGHPHYEITEGSVFLDGEDVLEMEVEERAAAE